MAFDAHGAFLGSANAPMQSFSIPGAGGPGAGGQKNYVFVDEHNRHKRLKVMRACEGCRRRKIKCDGATTNTWPCSACRRLKLHCQPPTINQENAASGQLAESDNEYQPTSIAGLDPTGTGLETQPHHFASIPPSHFASNPAQYGASQMGAYHIPQYNDRQETQQQLYQSMHPPAPLPTYAQPHPQPQPQPLPQPPLQSQQPQQQQNQTSPYYSPARLRAESSSSPLDPDQSTAEGLSEALGDLKISEDGIAPYLRKPAGTDTTGQGPVQDFEMEVKLPPLSTGAGSQIRIPPALLPSEEDAQAYFQVYFDDIHPYVPVINKEQFLRQWRSDRKSISPLLLEALFACSGRLSDDPAQGAQWLALAARHEEYFLDRPRLSTLQALLLLLKARESAPKRGYYYKSWMTVKTAVSMAKSMELDEHLSDHEDGGTCGSDPVDCLIKTRVWQTLMICEMMIGGPQGRHDFDIDPATVDIRPNPPNSNINPYEATLSRQFAYWTRNALNIRVIVSLYVKLRKQKEWYANPKLVANNEVFQKWPEDLPEDLRITFPRDGSAPFIPSHFLGNMHAHYQLGIIMLQRPQLLASKNFAADAQWRHIFSMCYTSAKLLCRLQEAILERYGISGLLVMQRGINFSIYGILTCTMLHLVAITSPYPEFSLDAREYFTRHMRILEQCVTAWPMPDLQQQVDALRVAFSADTSRPFELKRSFPYSSPSEGYQPSPPMDMHYQLPREQSFDAQQQMQQYQTITPPISAGPREVKNESPHMQQPMGMITAAHHPQATASMSQNSNVDHLNWNPSRLMNQWDSAFAIPPAALAPPGSSNSPPMNMSMVSSGPAMQQQQQQQQPQQAQYTSQYTQGNMGLDAGQPMHGGQYMAPQPVFVTPRDWQQSVASLYDPDGDMKRRWDGR